MTILNQIFILSMKKKKNIIKTTTSNKNITYGHLFTKKNDAVLQKLLYGTAPALGYCFIWLDHSKPFVLIFFKCSGGTTCVFVFVSSCMTPTFLKSQFTDIYSYAGFKWLTLFKRDTKMFYFGPQKKFNFFPRFWVPATPWNRLCSSHDGLPQECEDQILTNFLFFKED